ncbi:hypothetical protein D3C78_1439030 [compost metagenome]
MHVFQHAVLGVLGAIVLADLLVTAVVADAVGQGQVHHAVAVAQRVVGVGIHEGNRFAQGVMHMEVVVGGEHHERRGHLLHAEGQLGAHAPVPVLRHMPVIHIGVQPGNV